MADRKPPETEDEQLARLAARYIEEQGRGELEELERLNAESGVPTSPGFDDRVLRATTRPAPEPVQSNRRTRRSRRRAVWGALAAAIVLVALVPALWSQFTGENADDDPSLSAPEDYAPEDAVQDEQGDYAPDEGDDAPGGEPEIIPLSFTLPETFTVEDVLLDNGKTVYRLDHAQNTQVVMTLEQGGSPSDYDDGLYEMAIGDSTAYGVWRSDYSVLVLQEDDILYVLTSPHDIYPLIELGESILI